MKRELRNIRVEMEPGIDGEESPVLVFDIYQDGKVLGLNAKIRTGPIFRLMIQHGETDMHKINKLAKEEMEREVPP